MTKPRRRGCFVAFRNDRLGGRLNAILTAMRLAKAHGTTFRIFWALSEGSSAELQNPQDLFAPAFIDRHFTTRQEGRALLAEATDIGMVSSDTDAATFAASLKAGANYLSNAATEQLLLPWETAEDLKVLPALIHEIEFSPVVKAAIARIDRKLSKERFSSYHLRRGDIIDDGTLASHNLWPDKYIPRVVYEWHMKRQLAKGTGRLVIFSDEPREVEAFSALSARVSGFTDLLGEMDLTEIQRDFLELYTMSRSHRIFAPPSSAFSGLAAAIGNKSVTDVEADLPPAERQAAMDELVRRLAKRPDAFLSQSDAGQNLPFMAQHLDARNEQRRVVDITMRLVNGGMNRAYVYPFLSERMLAQGDYDGCDRLVEEIGRQLNHREEHWSNVMLHAALADLARGNLSRAIGRFHSGAWFYPINKLSAQVFCYLASLNRLPEAETLPFDPHLMRPVARIFDETDMPVLQTLMERLRDEQAVPLTYPANMEVRDWRLLSGKKLSFRFSNKAKVIQQSDILAANLSKRGNSPERDAALHSAVGAMLAEAGRPKDAERHLGLALEAAPDMPLYIKRQAEFLLGAGRAEEGIQMMEQAWQMSGRNPCYQAVLALACLKLKDGARYEELMLELAGLQTPIVELQFQIVEAMRRNPKHLRKIQPSLDRLAAMAPGSHRLISLQAKVHEQQEQWEKALAALRSLEKMGRPSAVLNSKLGGLYKAYRRAHDASAASAWFRQHGLEMDEDGSLQVMP